MRTNKKLAVLALGCVATLALGGAVLNTTTASAAEVNANKFEMDFGVQLALRKDAMRWIVQMGEKVVEEIKGDASLSVIVSSKAQFEAHAGDYINIPKKTEIKIPDNMIYQSGDYYYANAALEGLNATNQSAKEVVAIGVITHADGTVEYARFNDGKMANNVRTQYDVLQQVALDTREEAQEWSEVILGDDSPYSAWFGTEEFPLVVDTQEKYDSLAAKVGDGLNLYVEVDTEAVTLDADVEAKLPHVTKIYTVNFYNQDTLLKTVKVKEGEAAVAPTDLPKYYALEAMNGGYVRGYINGGWADASFKGNDIDISNITESQNVYIDWTWGDHTAALRTDWETNESNTVFSYDTELGVCHVAGGVGTTFTRSFDTTVKVEGQRGTTKLQFEDLGTTNLYVSFKSSNWTFNLSKHENDYVAMDVYADFGDATTYVWVRVDNVNGTSIQNKTWGRVIIPVSALRNKDSQFFYFQLRGAASAGSIYLSKATIVPASDVIDLSENTGTYKVGNTTFVGKAENYLYNGWSTKGNHDRTPNDGVFNQKFHYEAHLIDGEVIYSHDQGVDGAVRFTLNEVATGKLYITARGFADQYVCMQIFNSAGNHVGTPSATGSGVEIVDAGNGYKTYCFNLGSVEVKSFRLYTGYDVKKDGNIILAGPFAQVAIRDITIVK